MTAWFRAATAPVVVWRGLRYSVVVGAILILINHGSALLHGQIGRDRIIQMGLTFVVPYLVVTFSSVEAARDRARGEGGAVVSRRDSDPSRREG